MQVLLAFLLTALIFLGCDGTYENAPTESEQAFSVSMAPALAPSTPASLIPVNAQLILYASTVLDPSTINENTVYIQSSTKERLPAYVTLQGQDIILRPKIYLTPNTDYEIVVTTAVASVNGAHLIRGTTVSFTSDTGIDFAAPTIVSSLPEDGAAVKAFSKIYFQFSEPISPLGIDNSVITVSGTDIGLNISGTVNVSGSLISFTPDQDLDPMLDTNWNIFLDLDAISDLAGNGATALGGENNISMLPQSSAAGFITPKPLGPDTFNINVPVNCIKSSGNLLFVGSNNGLDLIEFDTVTSIFTLKTHIEDSSIGVVYSIDIDGTTQRAYIGSSNGLSILDITDISAPKILSSYETLAPVYGLDINGTDLYLAASTQGLIALNVTDETVPTEKFIAPTDGIAFDVGTSTTGIILADYNQGVTRFGFDGDWPENYPTTHQTRDLVQKPRDSTMFFSASGVGGIKRIDAANSTLISIPIATMPSYTTKVIADGVSDKVYTNDFGTGIGVVDSLDYFVGSYIPLDIDIITISSVRDTNGLYLILADTSGRLHSMQVE